MEEKKEKKTIKCSYAVLVIILFAALAFVTDYAFIERKMNKCNCPKCEATNNEVISGDIENKDNTDNTQVTENDENKVENSIKNIYNVNELTVKTMDDYSWFTDLSNYSNTVESFMVGKGYYASLDLNGKVTIVKYRDENSTNGVLNVENVIDILLFERPAVDSEQYLYLLTDSGDVYSYKFGEADNNNYNATKVDNVSNVKKMFISRYNKQNAGGSWALFVINGNNESIMIAAAGV